MTYKAYLAGPMRGVPHFNAPAFDAAAKQLRELRRWEVFNPAEQDRKRYGPDIHASLTGDPAELPAEFDIRQTVKQGLAWICDEADCIVVLPGWRGSLGTRAEVAVAEAIGLPAWPLSAMLADGEDA